VTKKKRDKFIDILVQRSPGAQEKITTKATTRARVESHKWRESPSVRRPATLRKGKRNPGIITALIPSLVPKLIAVAETAVTF
jgi:hypothetical protein